MRILTIISLVALAALNSQAQGIKIRTNMTIMQGAVMYVDGNIHIDDGELRVEAGSALKLSDGKTLMVNDGGKLTLMGQDGNPVTVTSAGYFVFIVNAGGAIGAEHTTFEKMSGNGLNVHSGAIIDPVLTLNNSIFQSGASGSTFLTINNGQTLAIDGVAFISTPGNELFNVAKTLEIGELSFTNFSGNFAGETYENDPFGLIHWSVVPMNRLVENVTVTSGQELCFDAVQSVTVQDLVVQNGGMIQLVAGQSVLLLPGILVEANGYLHAWIDPDGIFCGNAKAIVAVSDQNIPELKFDESSLAFAGVIVYPNPTTGSFTLEISPVDGIPEAIVEIYGIMGELIRKIEISGAGQHLFDLSDQARGVYIVRVLHGNKMKMVKVIRN